MSSAAERLIAPSELIVNSDGSVFHLHLKPGQCAPTVILVGDQNRVSLVAERFDSVECDVQSREFHTVTGRVGGKPVSVVSTGIGTDNIDIVVTELDALFNVDFASRTAVPQPTRLTLLRLGTCGGLQDDTLIGETVFSAYSVGFDSVLGYYEGARDVCDTDMERTLAGHLDWPSGLAAPYCAVADRSLRNLFSDCCRVGITVSAPGFYGPQGRWVRLKPARENLNSLLRSFRYDGMRVENYEMEGSALAGLAALMGHKAATICTVIAQRARLETDTDYRPFVERMIDMAVERLAAL